MTAGEAFTAASYATGTGVYVAVSRSRVPGVLGLRLLVVGLVSGVIGAKLGQLAFDGLTPSWSSWAGGGRAWIPGLLAGWLAVEVGKRREGGGRLAGEQAAARRQGGRERAIGVRQVHAHAAGMIPGLPPAEQPGC